MLSCATDILNETYDDGPGCGPKGKNLPPEIFDGQPQGKDMPPSSGPGGDAKEKDMPPDSFDCRPKCVLFSCLGFFQGHMAALKKLRAQRRSSTRGA